MPPCALFYAAALAALATPTLAQSGPFDVTTIVRLKRAWSDEGPADWGTKIRQMWPWRSQGAAQQFIPNGTVEAHARTNALGFPLRIGGGVLAAEVEDQVPECTAYGPCEGWDHDRWVREASPVTAPPIQPQRLDGDTVAIGETVRVRLTTRKNDAGGLACGLCSEVACGCMLMKGVNERYELAYDVAIIQANDLFYGKQGQWTVSAGPPNATFEEDSKHTFVCTRLSPFALKVWHEKNRTAAIEVPLEADRHRLKMFSGLGPTAYLNEGDDIGRLDGDPIAVGERVRVHLTNYDRVAISFGICSPSSCSVVGVQGVSKDKRLDYRTWVTSDDQVRQRDNPILDSRCISCGSRGAVAKGGTNLFVVHRRSETEMAVWLEDNPRDVVTVPLEPDRDSLKLETYFSVATFIRDKVWSASEAGAELLSPSVGGVSDVVCVSVVFLATSKDAGVSLAARAVNGTDYPLATIRPDKPNAWGFNRTVVDLPPDLRRSEWRLVVSAHLPRRGSTVHLQRVGGCNHLDDEDVMIVGESPLPIYVPGYNVSWGAPRQTRAAPARWCANGGVKDDFGACVCPPGFRGATCAEGCGPNKYGMDCGGRCSTMGDGCRGMLFCAPGLPCACAPGFKGETCDQVCDLGEYGNNCAQTCPYCRDGGCDPYTGQCTQDGNLLFGSECGRPPTTEALTVNGMLTSVDSFPWHGAVYARHASANQYSFTCGAALVTPSILISAAHCFYDHNLNKVNRAERYAVALGKTRSSWDAAERGTVHKSKVSAIHVPEAYRGQISNYLGDIALVELQDPVPPGTNIATVCVDPTITLAPDELLRVAGWGDETSALDALEYVNIPFVPTKTCYRRASDTLIKYITADKFCSIIQGEGEQKLAKGDSGGGAVVQRDGIWYLQGVVSLRQGTDDFTFTNVTHVDHLQWMKDVLKL